MAALFLFLRDKMTLLDFYEGCDYSCEMEALREMARKIALAALQANDVEEAFDSVAWNWAGEEERLQTLAAWKAEAKAGWRFNLPVA
jgi:hypothetical protein